MQLHQEVGVRQDGDRHTIELHIERCVKRGLRTVVLFSLPAVLLIAPPARADVHARLSLSSMLYTESSGQSGAANDASNTSLFYGDLRATVDGQRLDHGFEFKGDFRLRLTGDFDEAAALAGSPQITARGYDGGREYDLREAWLGRHGEAWDLGVGRLIVRESDALTVDGARVWWRFHPAWHASLYGGFYPNPFARSLPDSYTSSPALAVGGDIAYAYPRLWGSVSFTGTWLGGPGDGGPINPAGDPKVDPKAPVAIPTEAARVYLTSTNYLRAAEWLDLYHDLVIDVAGAAGAQVTRADAGVQLTAGGFKLAAGYAHLSSLAIEMYLLSLLNDRRNFLLGTVQNNLVVQRTARDEGRLRADVRLARLDIYGEARVRRRALLDPGEDPNFADVPSALAWDVTVGARDDGDLLGLRLGAAFTEITDYRAETQLVALDAGHDLWGERASLDFAFLWEKNRDDAFGATAPCLSTATLATACYGRRSGQLYEVGVTGVLRPDAHWFFLFDYRLVLDSSEGQSTLLSHVAFARIEVRL